MQALLAPELEAPASRVQCARAHQAGVHLRASTPQERSSALPAPKLQVRLLGKGASGQVNLALDGATGEHVGLKFIPRGGQVCAHRLLLSQWAQSALWRGGLVLQKGLRVMLGDDAGRAALLIGSLHAPCTTSKASSLTPCRRWASSALVPGNASLGQRVECP